MSETVSAEGKCLCGSVTIRASKVDTNLGACHCTMCRKWSNGPYLAVDCGTDVSITGEESVTVFNSSEWAERGFCNKCGTSLFYRLKENQQYMMAAEIFENKNYNFDHQIFIDEKPDYYSFANKTRDMTGAEVMASFSN